MNRLLLIGGWAVICSLQPTSANADTEVDNLVRRYRAAYDAIESIGGRGLLLMPPADVAGDWKLYDGWRIWRDAKFRFSKDEGMVYERHTVSATDSGTGEFYTSETERAFDGERFYAKDYLKKGGMIAPGKGGDQMPPRTNPLGHAFGATMVPSVVPGTRKMKLFDVWNLLDKSTLKLGDEPNQFVLTTPLENDENRVKVTLNENAGYVPAAIEFLQYDASLEGWFTRQKRVMPQTAKVDGVYVPTECVYYQHARLPSGNTGLEVDHRYVFPPNTLEVNRVYSKEDFQVKFDDDFEYHNFIVNKTFNEKVPVANVAPATTPDGSEGGSWSRRVMFVVVNGIFILAVGIAYFRFRSKRKSVGVLLLATLLLPSGCGGDALPPIALNVDGGVLHRVKLNAGNSIEHMERFDLTNVTDRPIHFGDIEASCGCTSVAIQPKLLQPGHNAVVKATVTREHFVRPKTVSLRVPYGEKAKTDQSLVLNVRMEPKSDWHPSQSMVQASGIAGKAMQLPLRLMVTDTVSGAFQVESEDGVSLVSSESNAAGTIDLQLEVSIPDKIGDSPATVIVKAPGEAIPAQWRLHLQLTSKAPGRWSPPSLYLESENEYRGTAEVILNPGIRLQKLVSSEGFTATVGNRDSDAQRVKVAIRTDDPQRFPTGELDAMVTDGKQSWPVRLIAVVL